MKHSLLTKCLLLKKGTDGTICLYFVLSCFYEPFTLIHFKDKTGTIFSLICFVVPYVKSPSQVLVCMYMRMCVCVCARARVCVCLEMNWLGMGKISR
jgi:hypothetical protein